MWNVTHPVAKVALEAVAKRLKGEGRWAVRRFAAKRGASRLYTVALQLEAGNKALGVAV